MALGVNIVSSFDSKGIRKAINDFDKLKGAGNKATFGLRTLDKAATNGLKNVAKFGGIAAAGLGAVALNFVKGAEFAKQADDRLAAVNKTMGLFGAQTGAVTKRLIEIGDKGEYQFGILAESIKDVQSKLLTFKEIAIQANVTGGLFDRATVAAIDLQAAGFGEATQNAVQLGKALNDPIKGITALARSGVTFTEQEKAKIKALVESGKMYEAQELLLKAIETQVGGTAAATTTATFKIASAFGHVRDELGTLLLPLFEKFADFMVNKVVPYATKFGEVIGEQGIGAGLKMLGGTLVNSIENMGALGNTIYALTAAFVAMRLVAIAATISQNLFNVALMNNPIGRVVAILIALGVAVVAAYIKFEGFRKVVNAVVNAVIGYIEFMLNMWIKGINLFTGALNTLTGVLGVFGIDIPKIGKIGEVAFGKIKTAANNTGVAIANTTDRMAELNGTFKNIKSTNSESPITTGATKTIETATQKLEKYIDALKGLTSAQRAYRDAGKAALKSDQDLLTAKNRLVTAQTKFNNVLNGYGANSVQAGDAQSELAKAQREVTRAGFDVQKSVFAVADAQKDLKDAYASGNSQQITEAQIALAEAQLAVSDATDAQQDSAKNLTTKQTLLDEAINGAATSSDTFKDAAQELKDAQDGLVNATDQQTDAYERQKDMLDALNESTKKAIILRGGVVPKDAVAAETKVGVTPTGATGGLYGSFLQAVRAKYPNAPSLKSNKPLADSRLAFPKLYAQYKAAGLAMAQGGIITQPTQILAGESGAEAIIPLDRLQSGSTINITVNAGMGSDGTRIGQMIVNELQAYQRRVGSLPLKVSS